MILAIRKHVFWILLLPTLINSLISIKAHNDWLGLSVKLLSYELEESLTVHIYDFDLIGTDL